MSARGATQTGTRLTLDLWHPRCWAIESTSKRPGGILAHAIYHAPETGTETSAVNGLFTAYGDSAGEVEALLDEIQGSEYGGEVRELQERFGRTAARVAPGQVAREFFLEYDPREMICPTLLEHGFVHSAPTRIEDGTEYWDVCFTGERGEVGTALDAVREASGAEITVERIASSETVDSERTRRLGTLTPTQREVFELARERGYYQWPRGVSTRELAAEAGVSKTTLLEHLRKAESKLLDPDEEDA
ncbi:helix-turn-helix domain-containing protein [Halogeometricum sp. S1BR25-6]|uniref:Helix-turn-helix domain-containing protein n=1 Tax=Halogeometricum salsisoli TaxID=2950536 RepID=A0ABU2GE09_9EURY|nr:helix-turn-helix domain-containing protein [Halogeometricum sp. S1BR25-6]MDS0298513.1 helix-turn-helix domain-containing protein [Halogeometricum sp. S1BR25-6]